jgi:uncharacterized membrane protein
MGTGVGLGAPAPGTGAASRLAYIDWARALAVLVMIEAHTLDAWTRASARRSVAFRDATVLGGFAAPLFLWLAGLSVVLAATRVAERRGRADAVDAVARRGLEIFALAFLFRLQAFVASPGGSPIALFRVDILNVMGPALVGAALVWATGLSRAALVGVYAAIAAAIALATPIVRVAPIVDALPTFLQWYVRPAGEHTTFTLFPWAGFVFAGAAVGALIAAAPSRSDERRLMTGLGAAGATLVAVGFYTATLPSIYRQSSFWTSSPTWFAIRSGILMIVLAAIYGLSSISHENTKTRNDESTSGDSRDPGFSWSGALAKMGRSSLFVYWIHVELVYGYASWLWRGRLPLWGTAIGYVAFVALIYGALVLRDRVVDAWRGQSERRVQLTTT